MFDRAREKTSAIMNSFSTICMLHASPSFKTRLLPPALDRDRPIPPPGRTTRVLLIHDASWMSGVSGNMQLLRILRYTVWTGGEPCWTSKPTVQRQ